MISLTQQDYNILKQKYIRKYIKIDLLDFKYNIVDELSGNCISFSNTIDANSDLRRGCSVEMVITDSSFEIKAGSKIFLDNRCPSREYSSTLFALYEIIFMLFD